VPSVSHLGPTHLGLDVHKDTISVAILAPDRDGPDVERITHDEASIRRLVGAFQSRGGCEPATRPARSATSWPGCWPPCTCAAR
jgi:hypothetical protein